MLKGMGNMANMMKQAREMQKNMENLQKELEKTEMEGSAGGMVTVVMTGKNEVRSVKINPEVVDKDDVETLEDLVAAAVNDAHSKITMHAQTEMNKITGGMKLPGM